LGEERDRLIRRLGGKPLSEERISDAELMAKRMDHYRREQRLPHEIEALRDSVLVVGYGTLLSRASVARTLGGGMEGQLFTPVVVRDFKRLFNLRPDHYTASMKHSRDPVEVLAANAQPSPGSSFNGLAFRVAREELAALDERERWYDRVRVPLLSFPGEQPLGEAHIYSAGEGSPWVPADGRALLPRWEDVVLARGGAYEVGEEFGRMFDRTTYLADGKTLLVERYREHLPPQGEDAT